MVCASPPPDIEAIVIGRFSDYLGTTDELLPESDMLTDLGLDSVGLVTILLDLADELELNLGSTRVKLAGMYTVADVIRVVRSLYEERTQIG
jgi:acyl carrier protein